MPEEQFQEVRDRLITLETLVGASSDDGLRADVRALKKTMHEMERRFYLAAGAGAVLYFIADHALR